MDKRVIFFWSVALLFVDSAFSDYTITVAPAKNSEQFLKQTVICGKCKCYNNKVDCFDQSITELFTIEEWNDLKDIKPTHVDLSKNNITYVTLIGNLPIEILNVSRCSIKFIERGSFKYLQKMAVLDLSYNKLTSDKLSPRAFEGRYTPEEYESLPAMRKLNLAYNDLHYLDQDLFEYLPRLTELDLTGNPLIMISRFTFNAISSLQMLKVLHMRSCQLEELPEKFLQRSRYLERLDISDNRLTFVPQALKKNKNLIYLNLDQNPIIELKLTTEDL